MRQIISHLWLDDRVEEAVDWYVSLFDHSKIIEKNHIEGTPGGDVVSIEFQLSNLRFAALNGSPGFDLNPSISIAVSCATPEDVDTLYKKISEGGMNLMPLDTYPFSQRYAWVADRFGLSWQIMVDDNYDPDHVLSISLLFAGEVCGEAEKALEFYENIFENSRTGHISKYGEGEAEDKRAKINYAELLINQNKLILMDHGMGGEFTFNEAYSLMILCSSQPEIDYYWDRLSHDPEAEQCGWLKDPFGVSWQIVPVHLTDWMTKGTRVENQRVTEAMLQMKKLNIADLEDAKHGLE